MKSILDGLVADGSLTKELMLTGFNEFVLTSLNYDSSANSFFVDLLNENYDVARDIMTAEAVDEAEQSRDNHRHQIRLNQMFSTTT